MNTYAIEIIRYDMPAELCSDFEVAYQSAAVYLQKSPYCLGYRMLRNTDSPGKYVIIIKWTSIEGHTEGFSRSPDLEKFLTNLKPYLKYIVEMEHYTDTEVNWQK